MKARLVTPPKPHTEWCPHGVSTLSNCKRCGPFTTTKKQEHRVDQMDRARAARCFVDSVGNNGKHFALIAFMDIFHPNYPKDKLRELLNSSDSTSLR
jgi:hypothetical protein